MDKRAWKLAVAIWGLTCATAVSFHAQEVSPELLSAKGKAEYDFLVKDFKDSHAVNKWELTIIDPSKETDTVSPDIRKERNLVMASRLDKQDAQMRRPNVGDDDTVYSFGISDGDGVIANPHKHGEVHPRPDGIWIVATFESFHEYKAASRRGDIYTEEDFRIEKVIRNPMGAPVQKGDLLSQPLDTGCMIQPNGDLEARMLTPSHSSMQPGGEYLMEVHYDPDTRYIRYYGYWEIKSGRVYAATASSLYHVRKGDATLDDVTLNEAESIIKSQR